MSALPADADARTLLHTAVRAHLSALLELHDYTSANVRIFAQVPAPIREAHIAIARRVRALLDGPAQALRAERRIGRRVATCGSCGCS